jgi:hypothetical protein
MHSVLETYWPSSILEKEWHTKWTPTWDNKAAFIPISKNCRNILIILVTGSTEPAYNRNKLSPKKHNDNMRISPKTGKKWLYSENTNKNTRYDFLPVWKQHFAMTAKND